ncbi:MAG: sigma-70 family RNA polymerase sigma factor [Saprospiraceae bacterium]|nr:sigma-70 family RNA polymerase sigma factor [Saprospiraceae bacterium]
MKTANSPIYSFLLFHSIAYIIDNQSLLMAVRNTSPFLMEEKQLLTKNQLLESWINEYSESLFNYSKRFIKNIETCQDIVQDVFIVAWTNVDQFRSESSLKTWLFGILKIKILEHYKAIQKLNMNSESDEYTIPKIAEFHWQDHTELLDTPDFIKILELCIDKLPEKWRIALLSKYLLEKKAIEICKELSITDTNYWQLLLRSKKQIRACLELNLNKSLFIR